MAFVPALIGGRLTGVIHTPVKIRPSGGFRLVLCCSQKSASGDTEHAAWQDEQCVVRELLPDDADRSAIPVLFQIPYDCAETGIGTYWRLSVAAGVPGIGYCETFTVPVFKTEDSNPGFVPDPAAIADYTLPPDAHRDLADAEVIKTTSPDHDGCRFVFPMGRNRGIMAFAILLLIVFSAMIPLSLLRGATPDVPIVFCLFDALTILFLLRVSFYRSVVDVSARGLSVTGGAFGLGRRHWIAASDVVRIDAIGRTCFNLVLVHRNLHRIIVGKWLPGPRLAASVIRQIEQALGKTLADAKISAAEPMP
jgi:hypothetical protein